MHAGDPCIGGPVCNDRCDEEANSCRLPDYSVCSLGNDYRCREAPGCYFGHCIDRGGGDYDGDRICAMSDNCPEVANRGQRNADSDTFGDACDPCPNIDGAQTFRDDPDPILIIDTRGRRPFPAPTSQVLRVNGEFMLPAGVEFSTLPMISEGARILLVDFFGFVNLDVPLPGGSFEGSGTRGWRILSDGRWIYRDRTSQPLDGVQRLTLIDRSDVAPGMVHVRVRGTRGFYGSPAQVSVVLGEAKAGTTGICGESRYDYYGDCGNQRPRGRWVCRR